ncbi:hypothetical protein RFM68_22305 [Mesorhizobium sp. MSK_1335]|uniref:Uncharacterized protein n=1 Tax=Mesorhizobium montanum TaxID=3072323 RepID=A0ABU4ZPC0_9HYPH|nr:hypothetical protein [Mesorhizobium sp. MSK_1335]MDX8527238.1 hypothetical protein [Mesorhizobium sp. MSK_1335]
MTSERMTLEEQPARKLQIIAENLLQSAARFPRRPAKEAACEQITNPAGLCHVGYATTAGGWSSRQGRAVRQTSCLSPQDRATWSGRTLRGRLGDDALCQLRRALGTGPSGSSLHLLVLMQRLLMQRRAENHFALFLELL